MQRWMWVGLGLVSLAGCGGQAKVADGDAEPRALAESEPASAEATPAPAPLAAGGLDAWVDDESAVEPSGADVGFAWGDRTGDADTDTAPAQPAAAGGDDASDVGGVRQHDPVSLDDDMEDFQWASDRQEPRYASNQPAPSGRGDAQEFDDLSEMPTAPVGRAADPAEPADDRSDVEVIVVPLLVDIDELEDEPVADPQPEPAMEMVAADPRETEPPVEDPVVDETELIDIDELDAPEAVEPDVIVAEAVVATPVVVEAVTDPDAMAPFQPMDAGDEPGPDTVWLVARPLNEAEPVEPEAEPDVTELIVIETEPEPAEVMVIEQEPGGEFLVVAVAPDMESERQAVEPDPIQVEPEPVEIEPEAVEILVVEPEPDPLFVEILEVEPEPATMTPTETQIVDVDEVAPPPFMTTVVVDAPPPAATEPRAPTPVEWKIRTPRSRMPAAGDVPALQGTVSIDGIGDDWVHRSLVDTLVRAGCVAVSGRNGELATLSRRRDRDPFEPAQPYSIAVSLPYHRVADAPSTRWLAAIDVVIDKWEDDSNPRQALQEISIRVGSQGISGPKFTRADLADLRRAMEVWAATVAPQIAESK